MKIYTKIVFLCVVVFLGSCSSDSGTDTFTKEERELRNLFNNEWEVVEERFSFIGDKNANPNAFESLEGAFDEKTYPVHLGSIKMFGMNQKREVYSWYSMEGNSTLLNFSYACTSQKGNKFTGYFNGITTNNRLSDMYIRKVDEETMKMVVTYEEYLGSVVITHVEVYVLTKIGSWDENMTVKKIFEKHDYSAEAIESLGVANYEREHGQGNCR